MILNSVDLPQPDGPMIGHELAGRNAERHVGDGGERAVRGDEALGDSLDVEEARGGRRALHRSRAARSGGGYLNGTWISSASWSFVSCDAVNLSVTASGTIMSRPTILSGSTAALGKNSSRVRFAIASGMPTKSA